MALRRIELRSKVRVENLIALLKLTLTEVILPNSLTAQTISEPFSKPFRGSYFFASWKCEYTTL